MVRSQDALKFWLRLAKWLGRVLAVASIVAGTLIKVAPSSIGLVPATQDAAVQKFAIVAFPLLLILVPSIDAIRRFLERRTLRPLIKEVLEEFRRQIFPGTKDPLHFHRVTLFRHRPWVFRWDCIRAGAKFGWLKVVSRTGHTTQNSRTVFFAPNDPEQAQGVAGVAWAWGQTVFKEGLPDLSVANVSDEILQEYAAASNADFEYIKKLKPRSRSLCGIPIEVQGRIWGVLVVDSRDARLPQKLINQHYAPAVKFLSRILERV